MTDLQVSSPTASEQATVAERDKTTDRVIVSGIAISPDYVFSSGKRLTSFQRTLACQYLMMRDGPLCQICRERELPMTDCDIDHINGDSADHRAKNLRRTCHRCNSQVGWGQKNLQQPSSTGLLERETQGRGAAVASPSTGVRLDPASGPTDRLILLLSRKNERLFRRFYFKHLIQTRAEITAITANRDSNTIRQVETIVESLDPNTMRVMARNESGCSRASSYSYEERLLIGPTSPCKVIEDAITGERTVSFREKRYFSMTVDELETMFPLSGLPSEKAAAKELVK